MLYNELVLQIRRPLRSRGSGQIFDLCNSFTRNRANTVIDCSTQKLARSARRASVSVQKFVKCFQKTQTCRVYDPSSV